MSKCVVRRVLVAAMLLPVVVAAAAGQPSRGKAPAEPPARAQWQVFQCRDAAGVRIFQDVPCPRAASHVRTLRFAGDTPADAARSQAARKREAKLISQWEHASQSRLPPSLGGATVSSGAAMPVRMTPRAPDACELAHGERDRAYRERGNALRFDDRRALLDRIAIACAR